MINLIKKLFGGGDDSAAVSFDPPVTGGDEDLINLVKYVVVRVVDEPAAVAVRAEQTEKGMQIIIKCDKADIGKIIGKSGKNIQALRTLVSGAAIRAGKKANVEVED